MDDISCFDVEIYKYWNSDLQHMSNEELLIHYHTLGKNEGRISSKLSKNKFYNKYSNFNIEIYKYFNSDLQHMSNEELLIHYHRFGKNEGRVMSDISEDIFNQMYPYFNIDLYRYYNHHLDNVSNSIVLTYYNYFDKNKTENIDYSNKSPKEKFRLICNLYIKYIRNVKLINFMESSDYESVFIEYRCLPHCEFLIRNAILKLGEKWCHTIICGNLNYEYMVQLCSTISNKIKIIKTNYDNLTPSEYSLFLSTIEFWNLLNGKKILIYQEDSMIFNHNIDDFLKWDYIGAPWPEGQNDNRSGVGNGGISLRTKDIMIQIINKINIHNTVYNSSTIGYMENTNSKVPPEDVYFTKNMEDLKIGLLADRVSAGYFSTECIFNENSFAGHNFWISDPNWLNRIEKTIFNFSEKMIGVFHPYPFTVGGGEKYLSSMIKYFIKKDYTILFFNYYEPDIIFETFSAYLTQDECKKIINLPDILLYKINFKKICNIDYFIYLNNDTIPKCRGMGKINIYHCQFPFDLNEKNEYCNTNDMQNIISSYQIIYVNSEFTKKYYIDSLKNKNLTHNNIHILYPVCFDIINEINFEKEENTFVMIGRIFKYSSNANNKYLDVAINIFNRFNNMNYKLYIIGSVKDIDYYHYLNDLIIDKNKIIMCPNISDNEKNEIIKSAKYYIQLTGMKDSNVFNQEHFGISTMECINYNCFPICYNGGYSSYLINNYENGILFNSQDELENIIQNILNNNMDSPYSLHKESFYLNRYTSNIFEKNISDSLSIIK